MNGNLSPTQLSTMSSGMNASSPAPQNGQVNSNAPLTQQQLQQLSSGMKSTSPSSSPTDSWDAYDQAMGNSPSSSSNIASPTHDGSQLPAGATTDDNTSAFNAGVSRFGSDVSNDMNNLKTDVTTTGNPLVQGAKIASDVTAPIGDAFTEGFKTLTDIISNNPDVQRLAQTKSVGNALDTVSGAGQEANTITQPAQQALQTWAQQHPQVASFLGSIAKTTGNVAGVVGAPEAAGITGDIAGETASLAQKGLSAGADAVKTGANAVSDTVGGLATKAKEAIVGTPEEQAVKNTAGQVAQQSKAQSAIDDEIRNTASKYPGSVGKVLNQAEVVNKTDPVGVLSSYEKGQALPTVAKGKLITDPATNFIKSKISELSNIKDRLVSSSKEVTPVDDFQTRTNAIIDSQKGWSAAKKIDMKAQTQKIINGWKDAYPNGIPNDELDNLKSENAAESTSYNSKSPFSLDAHATVAKSARQLVESNSGDAPVNELNKLIQSHYDAAKLLTAMRGKAPHGGALSRMINNTIGEVGGLGAGMAVGHPFLGAMAGRAGAEAVTEIINNHFISNVLKRSLVNNMKGTDPLVVQKALDYLDDSGSNVADDVSSKVDGDKTEKK